MIFVIHGHKCTMENALTTLLTYKEAAYEIESSVVQGLLDQIFISTMEDDLIDPFGQNDVQVAILNLVKTYIM